MYEILIGNKEDNIVNKLKISWIARILFIGCCWYLYDMFGRSGSLHIEIIVAIAIEGILLVNLFYMPLRLLGNRQVRHWVKLVFIIIVDITTLFFLIIQRRFQ